MTDEQIEKLKQEIRKDLEDTIKNEEIVKIILDDMIEERARLTEQCEDIEDSKLIVYDSLTLALIDVTVAPKYSSLRNRPEYPGEKLMDIWKKYQILAYKERRKEAENASSKGA